MGFLFARRSYRVNGQTRVAPDNDTQPASGWPITAGSSAAYHFTSRKATHPQAARPAPAWASNRGRNTGGRGSKQGSKQANRQTGAQAQEQAQAQQAHRQTGQRSSDVTFSGLQARPALSQHRLRRLQQQLSFRSGHRSVARCIGVEKELAG